MKPLLRLVVTAACLLAPPGALLAQAPDSAAALIGTWTLTSAEKLVLADDPAPAPNGRGERGADSPRDDGGGPRVGGGARGVLILDGAGNVFEFFHIPAGATGGDARSGAAATLADFGGFWGRYSADTSAGTMDFQALDGVSPNVQGLSFSRSYTLSGDRLIVTSSDEPHAQAHTRWTWQRNPVVENLSPTYRNVIGFWQHIEEGQPDPESGELQNPRVRAPSVIVYSPSGFVGVHFPSVGRESVPDAQTADDASEPIRGYLGYFGTLNVYPGEVSHNILSGVSPGTGSILRRYAEINGDELIVRLQSFGGRDGGDRPRAGTVVRLRRLSGADDMLPPR